MPKTNKKAKPIPGLRKYERDDGGVAVRWFRDELRLAYIEGYNANKTGKPLETDDDEFAW